MTKIEFPADDFQSLVQDWILESFNGNDLMLDFDLQQDISNVKVAIRLRPLIHLEKFDNEEESVVARGERIYVSRNGRDLHGFKKNNVSTFQNFDYIYTGKCQYPIYNDIGRRVIDSCVEGRMNSTVFAYGQTGSGKTYTMLGNMYEKSDAYVSLFDRFKPLFHFLPVEIVSKISLYIPNEDYTGIGLIPRICRNLFIKLEKKQKGLYEVKVRFVEVYNNKTRDLLKKRPGKFKKDCVYANRKILKVKDTKKVRVTSYQEMIQCIRHGLNFRITKSTKGNRVSSRSHAVFTIFVRTFSPFDRRVYVERKINLIDLAGSEKYRKKNYKKARQKEGVFINMSLLELGRCLGIASESEFNYIPVRANILTLLLRDSLGGNSETFMIATVSKCEKDVNESFCTLNYAVRCRKIRLSVKKGKVDDWGKKLLFLMKFQCRLYRKETSIRRKFENYKRRRERMMINKQTSSDYMSRKKKRRRRRNGGGYNTKRFETGMSRARQEMNTRRVERFKKREEQLIQKRKKQEEEKARKMNFMTRLTQEKSSRKKTQVLTIRNSVFWNEMKKVVANIRIGEAKIRRFLSTKLDQFDRDLVNEAVLMGLEGCALEYHEEEIRPLVLFLERRLDRGAGWNYGDFDCLI